MLGHAEPQISYPKIVKVEGNDKKWSWTVERCVETHPI